jgi:hypothetical protein
MSLSNERGIEMLMLTVLGVSHPVGRGEAEVTFPSVVLKGRERAWRGHDLVTPERKHGFTDCSPSVVSVRSSFVPN